MDCCSAEPAREGVRFETNSMSTNEEVAGRRTCSVVVVVVVVLRLWEWSLAPLLSVGTAREGDRPTLEAMDCCSAEPAMEGVRFDTNTMSTKYVFLR